MLPASTSNTAAGTPVTIEGNYFGSTPQVFFGGVAATNVQVHWNGELTADAPADPAGTAADQVVVTVTTGAGSSSSTGLAQVNEFTYAPTQRPTGDVRQPGVGKSRPLGQRDHQRIELLATRRGPRSSTSVRWPASAR